MATLYRVPLDVDPQEVKAFDMVEAIERHDIKIDNPEEDEFFVTGTQDVLTSFFRQLNGPGQSFPITEFVEFIQDYKLEV